MESDLDFFLDMLKVLGGFSINHLIELLELILGVFVISRSISLGDLNPIIGVKLVRLDDVPVLTIKNFDRIHSYNQIFTLYHSLYI